MNDEYIAHLREFDRLCDEFEAALKRGAAPTIEDYLIQAPEDVRDDLFRELLFLELKLREGVSPDQTDRAGWSSRFPGYEDVITQVWQDLNTSATQGPSHSTIDVPIAVGQIIDRYRILAQLGKGGMGTVFKARDTKLDRLVALKFPNFDLRDNRLIRRFYDEAQATANLRHASICPVYDVGETQGRHYISMALIHGRTLADMVRARRGFSHQEIVAVVVKIARAVQFAHNHGIFHRDLKPANIMIDQNDEPIVMDFGLARRENADHGGLRRGEIVGTPAYMPPEQVEGRHDDVGPQSDIYSLGVILFELATGELPFTGSVSEILSDILHVPPKEIREVNPELPVELSRICARMLAKKIEDRWESMEAVAETLSLLLSPPADSVFEKPPQRITSLAILPFANETTDAELDYLCDGITETLIDSMSRLAHLTTLARSSVFQLQDKPDLGPRQIREKLGVDVALFSRVQLRASLLIVSTELVDTRDGSRVWGQRFKAELTDLIELEETLAESIATQLVERIGAERVETSKPEKTANSAAFQNYLKGRFHWNKRNQAELTKAIDHFRMAIQEDPEFAMAYAGLADSYGLRIAWGACKPHDVCPLAKDMAGKALELDDALADAHVSLGYLNVVYYWDWNAAETRYRDAIRLNPNYATAHHWYGYLLMIWQRFDEAKHQYNRAQSLDPLSLIISANQAFNSYYQGRYAEALRLLESTMALDAGLASTHYYLGLIHTATRDYGEAIGEFQKSIAISNGVPGDLGSLGYACAAAGQTERAREVMQQLVQMEQDGFVVSSHLALICLALNDREAAYRYLRRAFDERDFYLIYIKVDPRLDPLRNDGEFLELSGRVGFPS